MINVNFDLMFSYYPIIRNGLKKRRNTFMILNMTELLFIKESDLVCIECIILKFNASIDIHIMIMLYIIIFQCFIHI